MGNADARYRSLSLPPWPTRSRCFDRRADRLSHRQVRMQGIDYVLHAVLEFIVDGCLPLGNSYADEVAMMVQRTIDAFLGRAEITRIFMLRRQSNAPRPHPRPHGRGNREAHTRRPALHRQRGPKPFRRRACNRHADLNWTFRTLPAALRGRSSTNAKLRGTL